MTKKATTTTSTSAKNNSLDSTHPGIAAAAEGKEIGADNYDPEALVEAMFSGAKAGLLPRSC